VWQKVGLRDQDRFQGTLAYGRVATGHGGPRLPAHDGARPATLCTPHNVRLAAWHGPCLAVHAFAVWSNWPCLCRCQDFPQSIEIVVRVKCHLSVACEACVRPMLSCTPFNPSHYCLLSKTHRLSLLTKLPNTQNPIAITHPACGLESIVQPITTPLPCPLAPDPAPQSYVRATAGGLESAYSCTTVSEYRHVCIIRAAPIFASATCSARLAHACVCTPYVAMPRGPHVCSRRL